MHILHQNFANSVPKVLYYFSPRLKTLHIPHQSSSKIKNTSYSPSKLPQNWKQCISCIQISPRLKNIEYLVSKFTEIENTAYFASKFYQDWKHCIFWFKILISLFFKCILQDIKFRHFENILNYMDRYILPSVNMVYYDSLLCPEYF